MYALVCVYRLSISNSLTHTHTDYTHPEEGVFDGDPLWEEKTSCLLSHLLRCLQRILLHCGAGPAHSFLTRERFDTLMLPLVHQVGRLEGFI